MEMTRERISFTFANVNFVGCIFGALDVGTALVAQWVKHWPADLAVPFGFHCTQPFIITLPVYNDPDVTEILLKRM